MNGTIGKTLVIRFSSIGDIILTSLLLRVLRRRFPDARIDFLVKSTYADLVRWSPHLNGLVEFPASGGAKELAALRRRIAGERYDLIIDLHDSIRSRFVSAGSAPTVRVRKRKFARTLLIRTGKDVYGLFGGAPPVAERYLETVAPWGITNDGAGLELVYPPEAGTAAEALLAQGGIEAGVPVIGVAPSARHATKIWPPDRFGAVAAALAAERRMPVVIFGTDEDRERCSAVAAAITALSPGTVVANLAGMLTLPGTAAALDRCALVLTNDSGIMHMAAARKRNVVAVFGCTVRQFGFFPYGTRGIVVEHPSLTCRPCTHVGRSSCPLGHFRCMLDLTVENVLNASRTLLQK
jgi:lipopolysaccharide heptosyltransferase II